MHHKPGILFYFILFLPLNFFLILFQACLLGLRDSYIGSYQASTRLKNEANMEVSKLQFIS